MYKNKNIFLGASGSIAAIKTFDIHKELHQHSYDVFWSATKSAECYILNRLMSIMEKNTNSKTCYKPYNSAYGIAAQVQNVLPKFIEQSGVSLSRYFSDWLKEMTDGEMSDVKKFLTDYESGIDYEGVTSTEKGHVKHINIAQQIDAALIAPVSANTLSKIANGITDNFVLEVIRAVPRGKKVYLALAMNTEMLEDPFIQDNVKRIKSIGSDKYEIIYPVSKVLQCGIEGNGAMADVKDIVEKIIG